jgi:hypothetical protein
MGAIRETFWCGLATATTAGMGGWLGQLRKESHSKAPDRNSANARANIAGRLVISSSMFVSHRADQIAVPVPFVHFAVSITCW